MRNAGAGEEVLEGIAEDIVSWVYDGAPTRKIYARAFSLLRKHKKRVASRYRLKQAIMELGPTGYPFEHFIGKVIEKMGFSVQVGQIVQGRYVRHEVDVVATRDHRQLFVECKYGQSADKAVSVQVPLYVRSRVDDIIEKRKESEDYAGYSFGGGVATNTRFTSDAVDYGTGSGLLLLGWDYPAGDGLREIIDRERIYPVTVLLSLTGQQKRVLLERGIVTCRQLSESPERSALLQQSGAKHKALLRELEAILD